MRFLDRLWHEWSPGYDASEDLRNVKSCLAHPDNLAAALAYYRAEEPGLHESTGSGRYAAESAATTRTPPQPALYLHGEDDGCVDIELAADAADHLAPGSRMERIEDSGHFLHLEHPDAVNERILSWILE
jgi:pimeloyl-ACP methyl ester carboxylesterase